MGKRLTKKQAEALHAEIRDGLLNIEKKIAEFAMRRGHLALGYKTFADYWLDRMSEVSLRQAEATNIVACVMYDEGATPDQVAAAIHGVTKKRAEAIRSQKQLGVAPEVIVVREHERKADRAPDHIVRVPLPPSTYRKFKTLAKRLGTTLEAESEIALRLHFAELSARGGRENAA